MTFDYPDPARVWGNDTSHWDGVINQAVAKQVGTHFTFIKAIDGTLQVNYFVENRANAIQQNIIVGAYAWLYPNNRADCKAQAQAYHNILTAYPVNLPPVIDFERYGVMLPNYSDLKIWATEFNRLGNRTGNQRPLLYSSSGYMNQFGQIPADVKALFCGIGIANYTTRAAPAMPIGYGANEWLFWQWSSTGDQANLAPSSLNKLELDLNYFNGTQEQLLQLCGAVTPPPIGDEMKYYNIVGTLNIRAGTSTATADIGDLFYGDKVEIAEVVQVSASDKWGKLAKITRANGSVFALPANSCYVSLNTTSTVEYFPPAQSYATLNITVTDPATGAIYGADNIQLPKK